MKNILPIILCFLSIKYGISNNQIPIISFCLGIAVAFYLIRLSGYKINKPQE